MVPQRRKLRCGVLEGAGKIIVLLSGGIDSLAVWRLLGLPPAIHFDLGTQASGREYTAVTNAMYRWANSKVIDENLDMSHAEAQNGYVDFRNSLLILKAAQHDPEVVLAAVAEWAPDKNERFYRRLERAVNMTGSAASNTSRLKIMTPYADISKGRLLYLYYLQFGVRELEWLLDNAWSCYLDGAQPCMSCGACRQRIAAEHEVAALAGWEPPLYSAPRWRIPWRDRVRWILDNGWLGVRQFRAHNKGDSHLPGLTKQTSVNCKC